MSSLIDIPLQLAMLLSLAASAARPDVPAGQTAELSTQNNALIAQPVEGPFNFSETIWLRALKESAPAGAADKYAGRIFKTSGGRFYVPAASERSEILQGRWDVAVASRVARAFAELNARRMAPQIGRAPTPGDLYLAHRFGPEAAISLIKLARANPEDLAAEHFEGLLETAPEVLFDDGKPVTVAALYERLTRQLRERSAPAQITSVHDDQRAAASSALALKPSLVAPEMIPADGVRALAFAWRSEVKGAAAPAPLQ